MRSLKERIEHITFIKALNECEAQLQQAGEKFITTYRQLNLQDLTLINEAASEFIEKIKGV